MNPPTKKHFASILNQATRFALQWRLLLLWMVVVLIPTALNALPLWQIIGSQLNHSVHSAQLAQHLSMNAISDLMSVMMTNKLLLTDAGLGAVLFTLLMSPFLSGAIVTAARSGVPLELGRLVHGGIAEYGRMLRMLVWALIPFGIVGAVGFVIMQWVDDYSENVILQSSADFAEYGAVFLISALLVLADALLDAGRAQFVVAPGNRSAIKAWCRGCVMVAKHPLATLGLYVVITLAGAVLVSIFGLLRMHAIPVQMPGFVLGLVLTQLIVASTAWMKIARIHALASASK